MESKPCEWCGKIIYKNHRNHFYRRRFCSRSCARFQRYNPERFPLEERIRSRTIVDSLGCWVWQGHKTEDGYGKIKVNGKMKANHRLMYEIYKGPIGEGKEIDHICRNRACCNPAHLDAVDHLENVRRGGGPKLTVQDVADIRIWAQVKEVTQKQIAKAYRMSTAQINKIILRQCWTSP